MNLERWESEGAHGMQGEPAMPHCRASSALALSMGILRALGGRVAMTRVRSEFIKYKNQTSAHSRSSRAFALFRGCLPLTVYPGC